MHYIHEIYHGVFVKSSVNQKIKERLLSFYNKKKLQTLNSISSKNIP